MRAYDGTNADLAIRAGRTLIAGIDEVGRGCLAGPVVAAAVILDPAAMPDGLRDSKQLSAARRQMLSRQIRLQALAWAVGRAQVDEIDEINILQATFLAMRRALAALSLVPGICLVDGNADPGLGLPTRLVVGGDRSEAAIMAASIVAKVDRDVEMLGLDGAHPGYGLAQHKGYGTADHLQALRRLGPSPIHRMSFSPCRAAAHLRRPDCTPASRVRV